MATTNASASRTITFTRRVGSFSAYITCDMGDVYVDYRDPTSTDEDNYTPAFSPTNKRILELNINNSSNVGFQVISARWKYGLVQIDNSNTCYRPVLQDGKASLEIIGPIASLTNNSPITITVEADVNVTGTTDVYTVKASYPIPVRRNDGTTYHVTIAAVDFDCNFTMVQNRSLDVQCLVYDPTGAEVTNGLKYQWYKFASAGWQKFASTDPDETKQTITIGAEDVDNQCLFKVEAYRINGDSTLTMIGEDTQVVYDNLDPYVLMITPTPEDEAIVEGDPQRQQIDYKIDIKARERDNTYASEADFEFYLIDCAGVNINSQTTKHWERAATTGFNKDSTIFTVTANDFINGGASLTLNIIAKNIIA